jgi:hypothetical protein
MVETQDGRRVAGRGRSGENGRAIVVLGALCGEGKDATPQETVPPIVKAFPRRTNEGNLGDPALTLYSPDDPRDESYHWDFSAKRRARARIANPGLAHVFGRRRRKRSGGKGRRRPMGIRPRSIPGTRKTHCASPQELLDYFEGLAPQEREALIEAHLDRCPKCRVLARRTLAFSAAWEEWTAAPSGGPSSLRR